MRYEVAKASIRTYRQLYEVFLKWVGEANAAGKYSKKLKNMEDITRPIAEDFARYIYSKKRTARRDIGNLRRIWCIMLPDQRINPWNIGLHLRPPPPKTACNYRPLTLEEAREFVKACHETAKKCDAREPGFDGRYGDQPERFIDLADAVVFAWHYGMRMGSLVSLTWEDFKHRKEGFFLHIPPKTRFSKPWPLELPLLSEIKEVLKRREKTFGDKKPKGLLFPYLSAAHKKCASNLASGVKAIFTRAHISDTFRGRAQMHSFRASFITMMDEAGAPTGITDAVTGHAARTVHDMYSHARVSSLKKWLDKAVPNLFEKGCNPEDDLV